MKTLVVKQLRKDGVQKVWRVKPRQSPCTFGTARVCGINSIDTTITPFEGVFQLTDEGWMYIDMSPSHVEDNKTTLLSMSSRLNFDDSQLEFDVYEKDINHLESFKSFSSSVQGGAQQQLFIVTYNNQFVRSELVDLKGQFRLVEVNPAIQVQVKNSDSWVQDTFENYVVQQKTINVEDLKALASIPKNELIDEDTKKPMVIALSAALVLLFVGFFLPKPQHEITRWEPREAQRIVVNMESLKKRKVAQVKAEEIQKEDKKKQTSKGGKVAGLLKNLNTGRISNLVGKVSVGEAVSKNIVVQNGIKAGTAPSGRALSALGNSNASGRDWGVEGSGQGVSVGTIGKGSGRSLAGVGGLSAGRTGAGNVGLIEDEGEVSGGLDRDVIAEYIRNQIGHILACYDRRLAAKKDLGGKVSVKFTIGAQGSVETQNITESTMRDATVEGCILNRVAKWTFPAPNGGTKVIVTYPFLFKSTN